MTRFVCAIALPAFVAGEASPVFACPFCESTTADQVRAGIFNSDFVYHLGVSAEVSFVPLPLMQVMPSHLSRFAVRLPNGVQITVRSDFDDVVPRRLLTVTVEIEGGTERRDA